MNSMTTNEPAVVDDEAFAVRRTIRIAAPVDKVWTAVTEAEHISRWFGRTVLVGSGAGAHGTMTWPDSGPAPLRVEACDPPRSITYRWHNDCASEGAADVDAPGSTVFTFTLTPTADGTELTVVESGFETTSDPAGNMRSHRQGWTGELDKLVALFDGGS